MRTDTLIRITCYAVLSEVLYQACRRIYRRLTFHRQTEGDSTIVRLIRHFNQDSTPLHHVLFFPDPGPPCRRELSGRECRRKDQCEAFHGPTSLGALLAVIGTARRSLDVCVFLVTCAVLGEALVGRHNEGVKMRVITEERNSGEEGEVSGSQIGRLRAAGIEVHCVSSSFLMHHKFMVVDKEVLVNGSFNWTTQAILGNCENLIVTSEPRLVQPFIAEFQSLWDKHMPVEVTSTV